MKKITYEEVKKAFEERGYELISNEYINCETKLEYICPLHRDKGIQTIDYSHLKRGQGCRFCGQENKKSGKQKNLEDYNAKEITESKGMEFVEIARENSKLYVYYICPKHKEYGVQKTSLQSMRRMKIGCPYCIGRNKTTESFKKELFKINKNIEVLDEYINATSPMRCRCLIDGHEWTTNANNLLCGKGCPKCTKVLLAKNKTKTNEIFVKELYEINPDITPLEEYISAKTKILIKCNVCGHQWRTTPDRLLQSNGCPECLKIKLHNKQVKTNEQFLKELKEVNPMLTPLEPYYNDHTKILVRCDIHNYEWYATPNKILHRSTGCPKCVAYANEKKLLHILDKLGYTTEPQKRFTDCRDKYPLPFDIYVKELNLIIEYDGEQHYKPIPRKGMSKEQAKEQLIIIQKHDKIKTEYCKNNNIPLIRIPYWEKNNIESFLYQKLFENGSLNVANKYS